MTPYTRADLAAVLLVIFIIFTMGACSIHYAETVDRKISELYREAGLQ